MVQKLEVEPVLWFKNFFKSTHIAGQHLFSMFSSILTFKFDLTYLESKWATYWAEEIDKPLV